MNYPIKERPKTVYRPEGVPEHWAWTAVFVAVVAVAAVVNWVV